MNAAMLALDHGFGMASGRRAAPRRLPRLLRGHFGARVLARQNARHQQSANNHYYPE
jgi:hypothetical protein